MRKMASIMLATALLTLLTVKSTAENVLYSGESLHSTQYIESGPYQYVMQSDCNLVLYKSLTTPLWSSHTNGLGANCMATLTYNGTLVIQSNSGAVLWTSPALGVNGNYLLIVQTDGNVVIYGPALWATNTVQS